MAKNTELILKIIAFAALIFLIGCANQAAPGGGEVDKVPPQIIAFTPAEGTVNFHGEYIELTFSKYVDKRSVQDAIFISPALRKGFKFDWSGKSVDLYFKDTLKKNTTYTLTIGTDVKDLNNSNKMAEAFSLSFSTGDKIDKGTIKGKTYDAKPDGVMVFAYKDASADPSKQSPDYISQTGKNGKYKLQGLSDGKFSIYAVRDKLQDLKYQRNEDDYGVQFKDAVLSGSAGEIDNMDFFLAIEDTVTPKVKHAVMKNRTHILAEFTKGIDSTKITAASVFAFDSTSGRKVPVKYFYKGSGKPNQFTFILADTLEKKDGWVLVFKEIPDFNPKLSGYDKTPLAVNLEKDTAALKIVKAYGALPEGKIDFEDPEVKVQFSDAVEIESIRNKMSFDDAKAMKYPFVLTRIDDALFELKLSGKLKESAAYTLKLEMKNPSARPGIKSDSLFQIKLTSSNELDFSGASGSINNVPDTVSAYVVLESLMPAKNIYKQKADSKRSFDFKKVIPGKYLLWGYKDTNKNGKYDNGSIKPHIYAEEFKYFPDTLNLRARWPVGDISLSFDKK